MAHFAPSGGEQVIRVVSEHWIKYVFPSFVYIVLAGVSILLFSLAGLTAHHSMWLSHLAFVSALMLFFFAHHWFFTKLLGESLAHIVVTNRRVVWIHETIFSREHMAEYAFDKMKTVAANKKGILQNVLRYGSIKFESGPDILFVPHPNSLARDIEQAMGLR